MQPSDSERALIKVTHCDKDIFGCLVPKNCPLCGQRLIYGSLEEAPVSIPSPFVNGHRERCSFLLKPTIGTFLRDYDGDSDLHVGITNTNGLVYNYNETGITGAEYGWEQCVSIPLVQPDMYGLLNQWDTYLGQFSTTDIWLPHRPLQHPRGHMIKIWALGNRHVLMMAVVSLDHMITFCNLLISKVNEEARFNHVTNLTTTVIHLTNVARKVVKIIVKIIPLLQMIARYEECFHNCYTYALTFINCVLSAQKQQQMNKNEFTEKFVIPQTRKASKYITIYKEICKNGFYVVDHPAQKGSTSTNTI